MSKNHRLFFSFASEDNVKADPSGGWVDNLIRYLTVYITRINNQAVEIIPLQASEKRPAALSESEGLIQVVTSNYLKSNLAKADAHLLADPSKVFKIMPQPVSKSLIPSEMRSLSEYCFFEKIPGGENYETIGALSLSKNFWLKIVDLAFEIDHIVYRKKDLKGNEANKVIFLAETSYDQVHNRDEVRREMIRHGHIVLPLTPFFGNIDEVRKQIGDCLKQADLSVHIVGETFGDVPSGSEASIVELQNQMSSEFYSGKIGQEEALHRLIWMPMQLKPASNQQKLYLDQLKDDITSTAGAEIIQTPLEILKSVIHSRLQVFDSERKLKELRSRAKSDHKSVYLLYDKKDESEISQFVSDLNSRNIEVILPKFEDKQIEFLRNHRQSLVKSDGVLLFANRNLNWVNSKLNDVIKAPGFGKQFPFDAKAIVIKDSSIPKDKIADFGDLLMLNRNGKDQKSDISLFLDKIAST